MKITMQDPRKLVPYGNNPRQNDDSVDEVAKSISEFGFRNPIIVDGNGVVIAGHTRLKAALKLGLKEVPTISADGLTETQIRAFRIAENRTGEFARWDYELLTQEFTELQQSGYGLDFTGFELDYKDVFGNIAKRDKQRAERTKKATEIMSGEREYEEDDGYNITIHCADEAEAQALARILGERERLKPYYYAKTLTGGERLNE